jgi:PhzF family phenazine biosynthesis protein
VPADPSRVVQECGAGLVPVRRDGGRLAFAAPPLLRSGPLDGDDRDRVLGVLGLTAADVVEARWVDNGPGWVAVLLADAEAVLAVEPDFGDVLDLSVGVVGPRASDGGPAWEVRAFFRSGGVAAEDPVTGSLNASLGQWLLGSGRATAPYVASQGTALGRRGRVHVDQDPGGTVWVGGDTHTCIAGTVEL